MTLIWNFMTCSIFTRDTSNQKLEYYVYIPTGGPKFPNSTKFKSVYAALWVMNNFKPFFFHGRNIASLSLLSCQMYRRTTFVGFTNPGFHKQVAPGQEHWVNSVTFHSVGKQEVSHHQLLLQKRCIMGHSPDRMLPRSLQSSLGSSVIYHAYPHIIDPLLSLSLSLFLILPSLWLQTQLVSTSSGSNAL